MRKNDTVEKYNTKTNKLERLFILAINDYYGIAICPEFSEADKFIQYVYMNKPLPESTEENPAYETFNINKMPKQYIEEIDNYVNKDMFKKLLNMFTEGLVADYGEIRDFDETLDFINTNSGRIFTKEQLHDFYDAIKYPTAKRLDLQEQLNLSKLRTITYGAWEKFKKDVIDRQG